MKFKILVLLLLSVTAASSSQLNKTTAITLNELSFSLPPLTFDYERSKMDKLFPNEKSSTLFSVASTSDSLSVDVTASTFESSNKNRITSFIDRVKTQFLSEPITLIDTTYSGIHKTICTVKQGTIKTSWMFFSKGEFLLTAIIEEPVTSTIGKEFQASVTKGDSSIKNGFMKLSFDKLSVKIPKTKGTLSLNPFPSRYLSNSFKLDSVNALYCVDSWNGDSHVFVSEIGCSNDAYPVIDSLFFKSLIRRQFEITNRDIKSFNFNVKDNQMKSIEVKALKSGQTLYVSCIFKPESFVYIFVSGKDKVVDDFKKGIEIK